MESKLNKKLTDKILYGINNFNEIGEIANECEKICLQYMLTVLDEEQFGRGALNRDEYKSRIVNKLQEQLKQLK